MDTQASSDNNFCEFKPHCFTYDLVMRLLGNRIYVGQGLKQDGGGGGGGGEQPTPDWHCQKRL